MEEETMQRGAFNIFNSFLTFCNVLTCFGFVPFRVNVKDGRIHKRSVHYTAFFLSLYTACLLVLFILGQQEPDAEESLLIRYGSYTQHLLSTSMVIFVLLFNYLKRHKIANCLLVMHHFDCMMEVGQMCIECN
jgi:hypothetical protein